MKNLLVSLLSFCLFALTAVSATAAGGDKDWRPVTPAEMALKTSTVEKDADAEAIFWEVRVDDSSQDELALNHYVRVKIFNERGRERFSKIDIPFYKKTKIKNVAARVVKPDGSIVELKEDDVFEREIIKASGVKIKAKTFAVPGIEPGVIVEYRYREIQANSSAQMRLVFQRDVPIQNVTYYVKPFSGGRSMFYQSFNTGQTKFEKDKNGFSRATMTNVPAFKEEPKMPPEDEVKSWMYIYYRDRETNQPQIYWSLISKGFYEGTKSLVKAGGDVKEKAAEITTGATTDDEKLQRIFDFCKTKIRNVAYDPQTTQDDRETARGNKSPKQTLANGVGAPDDIDQLFAALAKAAGFDARPALSGDRSENFFNPKITNVDLMLGSIMIAVNVNNDWRFYAPGSYYTNYGMLPWYEEGQQALVTDNDKLIWARTGLSEPEKSTEKRTGKLKLLEDGTLEGVVQITYTGHLSEYRKRYNREDTPTQREENLRKEIKKRLPTAEVSDIKIENLIDPVKPFSYSFKVSVPNYAQKTGKRLFLQPNFFEANATPVFTASTRQYAVYFNYPWAENDTIRIELPKNYALENPDAPAAVSDPNKIGMDTVKMAVANDGHLLNYRRQFYFGKGGALNFPVEVYPALKQIFENFNKADTHGLTLKQQ